MNDNGSTVPPISVVMSCYNAERWLAESIESVLSQTWRDFEFILVNDGSTDATADIIAQYAEADRRIVPVSKRNTGLADSLNTGIAHARGTWIARLDSDDLCEPNRLALQWRCAAKNAELVFIGTGLVLIDEHGRRSTVHRYPTTHLRLLANLITARKFPAHSSAFFRTEAFRRVGGYRPRIRRAEDWDLWLRLSEVGELTCVEEPLVCIRKHASQISHDEGGLRQIVDLRVAIVSYWQRRAGQPDSVEGSREGFEKFWNWVHEQIDADGIFARESVRNGMKQAAGRFGFSRLGYTARFVLSHPSSVAALGWERFFGSSLPRRLASEWMRSDTRMNAEGTRNAGFSDHRYRRD